MTLSYHPFVQRDVNGIMDHFREISGEPLADRFYQELMRCIQHVATYPERHPYYLGRMPFRRAKLTRFPHIIVFRILKDRVRISIVKHEKRHPSYGMRRL